MSEANGQRRFVLRRNDMSDTGSTDTASPITPVMHTATIANGDDRSDPAFVTPQKLSARQMQLEIAAHPPATAAATATGSDHKSDSKSSPAAASAAGATDEPATPISIGLKHPFQSPAPGATVIPLPLPLEPVTPNPASSSSPNEADGMYGGKHFLQSPTAAVPVLVTVASARVVPSDGGLQLSPKHPFQSPLPVTVLSLIKSNAANGATAPSTPEATGCGGGESAADKHALQSPAPPSFTGIEGTERTDKHPFQSPLPLPPPTAATTAVGTHRRRTSQSINRKSISGLHDIQLTTANSSTAGSNELKHTHSATSSPAAPAPAAGGKENKAPAPPTPPSTQQQQKTSTASTASADAPTEDRITARFTRCFGCAATAQ